MSEHHRLKFSQKKKKLPTIIFFNEKYYVHNIFCNTFTTKFMQKVVISSNLNPPLKLFFYSPILTNNNLLLKIYCENVVLIFLNYDFLFFILFLISLISFHPYVCFFFFFPPYTFILISLSPPSFLSFSPSFKKCSHSPFFFFSPALALYLFIFFF